MGCAGSHFSSNNSSAPLTKLGSGQRDHLQFEASLAAAAPVGGFRRELGDPFKVVATRQTVSGGCFGRPDYSRVCRNSLGAGAHLALAAAMRRLADLPLAGFSQPRSEPHLAQIQARSRSLQRQRREPFKAEPFVGSGRAAAEICAEAGLKWRCRREAVRPASNAAARMRRGRRKNVRRAQSSSGLKLWRQQKEIGATILGASRMGAAAAATAAESGDRSDVPLLTLPHKCIADSSTAKESPKQRVCSLRLLFVRRRRRLM